MFARRDLLVGLVLSLVACKGNQPAPAPTASETANTVKKDETISLTGAGATFPYPLYSKWISEYNKLNPNVKINYQSIGSGGGIRQISANTVDFGATDAPMKDEEAKQATGKLFHIPATIGAVVVAYNLPEVTSSLKLTPEVLVGIYAGKIRMWNDPKIKADNADAKLPAKDISVVYRTDGSGTTAVFTDYLGKISADWKEKVGVGKVVNWPTGLGAKGNEGVTGQVKTTPYTKSRTRPANSWLRASRRCPLRLTRWRCPTSYTSRSPTRTVRLPTQSRATATCWCTRTPKMR
jgi:phosphate transport system substrate-binding protein